MRSLLFAGVTLLASTSALADWTLNPDASKISFTSTKANIAAEVHGFRELAGGVDKDGRATLEIRLDSVDTAIEIRDERMRDMLFETGKYPLATVNLKLDPATIASLKPGERNLVTAEAELALHGTMSPLTVEMYVAKLTDNKMIVTSTKPVIVNASTVGLEAGIEKLRNVAGLPSISPAVPVTFALQFDKDPIKL
ncbi:MAG: YceI family protein [Pseudomonadota bacterium]